MAVTRETGRVLGLGLAALLMLAAPVGARDTGRPDRPKSGAKPDQTGNDKPGEDTAKDDKAKGDKAKDDKTKGDKAKDDKPKGDKGGDDTSRDPEAKPGKAGDVKAGSDTAKPDKGRLTAMDIMRRRQERSLAKDERAEVELRVEQEGRFDRTRKLVRYVLRTGNRERTLIRFTSPLPVRGLAVLTIEQKDGADAQWLYNNKTRKSKRVPRGEQTEDFAGTGFAVEDFRAEVLDANNYKLLGKARVQKRPAWLIEATPKSDHPRALLGYGRRVLAIDAERYVILRIEFYDKSGERLKVQDNTRWAVVGGVYRPYRALMREVASGRKTYVTFKSWAANEGLPLSLFTLRNLEKEGAR